MNFSTISKRSLGLTLILCFSWLLLVTAAPLKATDQPATVASENDNPGAIEQSGQRYTGGHSSALPIIIGVVAVVAIAAVLILVVFKTKYDITGTWSLDIVLGGTFADYQSTLTCSGSKSSGTITSVNLTETWNGSYTVSGKNVTLTTEASTGDWVLTGSFTDKTHLSGTMNGTVYDLDDNPYSMVNRPWTATKTSTPQSRPKSANSLMKARISKAKK